MPVTSTFHVEGMSCGHCVRSVEEEVSTIPGVAQVDVDLESGRLLVTSDEPVPTDAVKAAVDEAGYALAS